MQRDRVCPSLSSRPVYNSDHWPTALKSGHSLTLCHQEGFTMGHCARLQLIGKVTYYVGWIALLCGGLVHLNIATRLFLTMHLTQRNLFEVSVVCFLICIA